MKKRIEVKEVAVCMVKGSGLINLSRSGLCQRAGIPDGSFPHVMGCNFSDFVEELRQMRIPEISHSVSKTRANPELRREHILSTAMILAQKGHYNKLTRDKVAEAAGVSMGLVSRYFGSMDQLKTAIMRRAVKQSLAVIVAHGIANGDEQAKKAPAELRAEAHAILATY